MTVDWNPVTPEEWVTGVKSWPWKPHRFDNGKIWYWKKDGNCPRCHHYMWKDVGGGWASAMTLETAMATPETNEGVKSTVNVACNCTQTHTHRPDNKQGCGPATRVPGPHPSDAAKAAKDKPGALP